MFWAYPLRLSQYSGTSTKTLNAMNIVREFYEDFIKPKAKVPRFRKKRMDDVINTQQPEAPTETVETPEVPDAEIVEEEEVVEAVAKDPSFNCVQCSGEGLAANGSLCGDCKGTGKV